jgi:hypothetical protein
MSSAGAAPRAAVATSSACAEASRKNGAKSRGPKTAEGKARSARNALKHGMRSQKYIVLPQEDAGEFRALEAALFEELAPAGALQAALARRIAVAAWRLERAERLEVEVFAVRGYGGAGPGLMLIRDGNGTRSIETVMRYRGAAMAELTRALRTLKALQAEQAAPTPRRAVDARPAPAPLAAVAPASAAAPLDHTPPRKGPSDRAAPGRNPIAPEPITSPSRPERPDRRPRACLTPGGLHEAAAGWLPNEPGPGRHPTAARGPALPDATPTPIPPASGTSPSLARPRGAAATGASAERTRAAG